MTCGITEVFAIKGQIESVEGVLHDAGLKPDRITGVGLDRHACREPRAACTRRSGGT
jgi:hypothetical protein